MTDCKCSPGFYSVNGAAPARRARRADSAPVRDLDLSFKFAQHSVTKAASSRTAALSMLSLTLRVAGEDAQPLPCPGKSLSPPRSDR